MIINAIGFAVHLTDAARSWKVTRKSPGKAPFKFFFLISSLETVFKESFYKRTIPVTIALLKKRI